MVTETPTLAERIEALPEGAVAVARGNRQGPWSATGTVRHMRSHNDDYRYVYVGACLVACGPPEHLDPSWGCDDVELIRPCVRSLDSQRVALRRRNEA